MNHQQIEHWQHAIYTGIAHELGIRPRYHHGDWYNNFCIPVFHLILTHTTDIAAIAAADWDAQQLIIYCVSKHGCNHARHDLADPAALQDRTIIRTVSARQPHTHTNLHRHPHHHPTTPMNTIIRALEQEITHQLPHLDITHTTSHLNTYNCLNIDHPDDHATTITLRLHHNTIQLCHYRAIQKDHAQYDLTHPDSLPSIIQWIAQRYPTTPQPSSKD